MDPTKNSSYWCSAVHGNARTSSMVSAEASLRSKQSPTRRSTAWRSPALEISPVDDRLALKYQPATAPISTNPPTMSQPNGMRRQRGIDAGAAADHPGIALASASCAVGGAVHPETFEPPPDDGASAAVPQAEGPGSGAGSAAIASG